MPKYKHSKQIVKELIALVKEEEALIIEMEERRQKYQSVVNAYLKKRSSIRGAMRRLQIENINMDIQRFRFRKRQEVLQEMGRCINCSIKISGIYLENKSVKDPRLCYSCAGDDPNDEDTIFIYKIKGQV